MLNVRGVPVRAARWYPPRLVSSDRAGGAAVGLALLLMLVAAPMGASAQDASRARESYLAADFPGAARSFEAVLAADDATRDDTLEAHRYLATLRFLLGNLDAAEQHARAAITLDQDAEPAEGSPAEIAALFAAARNALGEREPLQLELDTDDAGARRATAVLAPWPSALGGTLAIECLAQQGEGAWATRGRAPRVTLDVPSVRVDTRCVAELAPSFGAVSWLRTEATIPAAADRNERSAAGNDDALLWGLVGGGAALVAIGVIVAVVLVSSSSSENATFAPTVSVPGW